MQAHTMYYYGQVWRSPETLNSGQYFYRVLVLQKYYYVVVQHKVVLIYSRPCNTLLSHSPYGGESLTKLCVLSLTSTNANLIGAG